MVVAQQNRTNLVKQYNTFVKQLNRQLEGICRKLFLRSSITWIAFPFASGLLAEFRVVYYPTDTSLPFFMRCPAVLLFSLYGKRRTGFYGLVSFSCRLPHRRTRFSITSPSC